jgi:hypothetical protein
MVAISRFDRPLSFCLDICFPLACRDKNLPLFKSRPSRHICRHLASAVMEGSMSRQIAAVLVGASTVWFLGCYEPVQATDVAPGERVPAREASVLQSSGPFDQTCSYRNAAQPDEDAAEEVFCTMRYVSTDDGIRYTFRFGGRMVTIDRSGEIANGLWRGAKIDGRPAVSLELWRGSYVAVSTDLGVTFEWRDRDSPKFPAN